MKKVIFIMLLFMTMLSWSQQPAKHRNGVIISGGASDPTGVEAGQIWWDSDDLKFRKYDGSVWSDLVSANTDNQTLSFSSPNLSISGGNSVDISAIDTQLTDEQVQDKVGAMVSSNTETLITATYQDSDGTIDFVVDNDLSNYDNTTSNFSTGSHFTPTSLLADYSFTDNSSNWDTAYGWGNHATAGYLTSEVDGSITNEIQTIDVSLLSGTNLLLSLSNDGEATKSIDLSPLQDGTGTDDQVLSEVGAGGFVPANYTPVGGTDLASQLLGIDIKFQVQENSITTNTEAITDNFNEIELLKKQVISVALSDLTTDITTGASKGYIDMPWAATLTDVKVSLLNGGSVSGITIDVNENGTSVLSTKLTTDATETSSSTASVPPVISDSSLANNARVTFDIDSTGTGLKGAIVYLYVTKN